MRARRTLWITGAAALGLLGGGCAHRTAGAYSDNTQVANGQNGGQNAGGYGQSPEMQRFQQKYPGTSALMRSMTGVRILLRSDKHPLTPEQARSLDGALRPLLTMPTLPQDRAQQISQQVSGSLTPDQQTDIGLLRRSFRGRRGMGGMRGNRPGGPGGPGGAGTNGQPGEQGQQGGRRMRWMNENMPADQNIFRNGPAQQMLTGILDQLKTIEKG